MKPTPGRIIKNKMKAMKGYLPSLQLDSKTVIEEFMAQQQEILLLLDQAASNNIARIRIPISVAMFIRLKLGDTFRFLLAHEQRHMLQAENAILVIRGHDLAVAG